MSYLYDLFSLELSLKRVISCDVQFVSMPRIILSSHYVKWKSGESAGTVLVDLF